MVSCFIETDGQSLGQSKNIFVTITLLLVTRKAFRKRILNSKQILWYFGFRTWHKLHTDYKWILLFNLMGQAGRLHVFPWRSPPCFSSNKAHWLAAFVSCHLTPCRWTRRLTLEVRQCCVQDVLLSLSLEHNHLVTTNASLQESWDIQVLFGAGPRFMLYDQRAMQNIFTALNLKLIIFATAIIHQVTQVQHQSLQTLTKLVRKWYFFLPSWSVIFVGWFHICSLIILCEKSRFFAKLKLHILG